MADRVIGVVPTVQYRQFSSRRHGRSIQNILHIIRFNVWDPQQWNSIDLVLSLMLREIIRLRHKF